MQITDQKHDEIEKEMKVMQKQELELTANGR